MLYDLVLSDVQKLHYNRSACASRQKQYIYLFGGLRRFQHCTGDIMMGSWKGRGNQYIQFVRVLYCKLRTNSKQLPAFPLETMLRTEPQPQRWEVRVLPLCHHGPQKQYKTRQEVCTSNVKRQDKPVSRRAELG